MANKDIKLNSHTKYKIGKTIYIITAHYKDDGDSLPVKIKRLLKSETDKNLNKKI